MGIFIISENPQIIYLKIHTKIQFARHRLPVIDVGDPVRRVGGRVLPDQLLGGRLHL